MALSEFFCCSLLAFGAPLMMFMLTIANDPVRIIIMIAASFFWLLSLLLSSIVWFAVVPLKSQLAFGLVFSILFQELFRYFVYKILRKTEAGLKEIADDQNIGDHKYILAYVSGFGFGIISGAFAIINVLADSVGPGTVGLISGSEMFFFTSSLMTLCMILLHTFWGVIFFNALDEKKYFNLCWVVGSHLFVSCLSLLNKQELYYATILPAYIVLFLTICIAYKSAGGSVVRLKQSFSFKN